MPELEVLRVILSMALQALNEKGSGIHHINNVMESVDRQSLVEMVGGGGASGLFDKGYLVDIPPAEFLSINDIHLASELVRDVVDTVTKIYTIHNKGSLTKTEVSYMLSKIKQGLDIFVPRENRLSFIKWLIKELPNSG